MPETMAKKLIILIFLTSLVLVWLWVSPSQTGNQESPVEKPPTGLGVPVDEFLTRLETLGFSGAVIVEHEGQVVLAKGYGFSDRGSRQKMTPENVFTMGSITKQITAAAVALLEYRGKVDTQKPLSVYLAGITEDKRGITPHHLLTHTSGLVPQTASDFELIGREQLFEQAMATPLSFEPGASFEYSNLGYSLLGYLIEEVSGQDYETFIYDNLLKPAGMEKTGYNRPDWEKNSFAIGYLSDTPWGTLMDHTWIEDGPGWILRANGGLATTVWDMHKWLSVVKGNGVLPEEARQQWLTPHVDQEGGECKDLCYTWGWEYEELRFGRMISHSGGNGIFRAHFVWLPEAEFFIFLTSTNSLLDATNYTEDIIFAALTADSYFPAKVEDDPKAVPRPELKGVYEAENNNRIFIQTDDVRLIGTFFGQTTLEALYGETVDRPGGFSTINSRAEKLISLMESPGENDVDFIKTEEEGKSIQRIINYFYTLSEKKGGLEKASLVGSLPVDLAEEIPEAKTKTLVLFEFKDGAQVFHFLWDEDGVYLASLVGPRSDLPQAILVPTGANKFQAINRKGLIPLKEIMVTSLEENSENKILGQICLDIGNFRLCQGPNS